MVDQTIVQPDTIIDSSSDAPDEQWHWYHLLPLLAIGTFIITPILTQQFGVPGAVKWLGDMVVAAMLVLAFARMFSTDRIHSALLIILVLTIISIIMAVFESQHPAATLWGWWTVFRYPMVGLFAYMLPNWPKSFAKNLPPAGIIILLLQFVAQLANYAQGTEPGDLLSGTLGKGGTGSLILIVMFFIAIALGKWLVSGDWLTLMITISLGAAISVLGEMKLFAIATPIMGLVALLLHFQRRGKPQRILVLLLIFTVVFASFIYGYNAVVSDAYGTRRIESFLEDETYDSYDRAERRLYGTYYLGRSGGAQYGWQVIQRDIPTMLFGMGLGTAQIASTFQLVGSGISQTTYGQISGATGLMVLTIEMGLFGLFVLLLLIIYTTYHMFQATRKNPDRDLDPIRLGILLFTLLWPLWIYYNQAWFLSPPMILYWVTWGYTLHFSLHNKQSSADLA